MARLNSAQVVINEQDLSAIAMEAFGHPYLILGETAKGRDDKPILITNKANFSQTFGAVDPNMPSTYAALEYLSFGNQLWFKRVTSTKMVKVISAGSVTFSVKTASPTTITLPSSPSPYFTGDTTQPAIAIYVKDTTGTYEPFKVYITAWSSANIYKITWDSYGKDWNDPTVLNISSVTLASADVYVSHAEPAFNSDVYFPKTTQTIPELTFTYNSTEKTNYLATNDLNNTDYYVSAYTDGGYGPNILPIVTGVASGGNITDGYYVYRVSFTDGQAESAVSAAVHPATVVSPGSNTGSTTFALPALPSGYTGWNIYRAPATVGTPDVATAAFTKLTVGTAATSTSATYTDTLAVAAGSALGTCPILVSLNGTAMLLAAVTNSKHFLQIASDGKTVIGEYIYEVFLSGGTTYIASWRKGDSPALAVSDVIKKVIAVATTATAGGGAAILGNGVLTDSSTYSDRVGKHFISTLIPIAANTPVNTPLWNYTGTGNYTVPTTDTTFQAYTTTFNNKYYYYKDTQFDRYSAVCKGRGTWANGIDVYTTLNGVTGEYEVLVYDSYGTFVEKWSSAVLATLINNINEYSSYITLYLLQDSTDAAIVAFDTHLSGSSIFAQYYKGSLTGGYDGYFAVDPADFIANIDSGVAGGKESTDPEFSDLLASAQQIESFDLSTDYELMFIPTFSSDPSLAAKMGDVCLTRKFSAAVFDTPSGLNPNNVILFRNTTFAQINNSYSAMYWNHGKIYDAVNEVFVWLPPSIMALRAMAFTDATAESWFAPAGLRRGLVPDILELEYYPNLGDREALSAVQINPIARINNTFAVWDQNTTQKQKTMLSNFNVRRMLISAEKAVFITSQYTLFEPNDPIERQRLILTIQPIFDTIRQERGLIEFGIFDATTTQDEANNEARLRIELKPTPTMKIIQYDIVVKNPTQSISK